ncbi:MAG: phosphoheptose isomerase [Alphaproteobacteria bacterium]|nr:phosphoheptose isomerase [Alphaproteobacteria bacterium]|tara:strand:+ start:2026 stop:2379 length:354 start_codon:yes stop_codon:yes gene_type:complete
MKKKVLCFDLDNTICKTIGSDYDKSTPIIPVINLINRLHKKKHKIIIFTARYMGRNKENSKIVYKKYYSKTYKQLQSWNLKFNKLIMGKPTYDMIIDDKSFNFKKNWVKSFEKKFLL